MPRAVRPTVARLTPVRWSLAWILGALLLALPPASDSVRTVAAAPLADRLDAVGMTVSDADRAIAFYTDVLSFRKVSDVEVWGDAYEHLQGLFGVRMRVARLQLGDEMLELTEYLTPRGRPIPADARSNDRTFQHVAIIVSDMDRAYQVLREHRVQHASTAPQTLPAWNQNAAGISAFYFKDPDGHSLEALHFPSDKGLEKWHRPNASVFMGIDHTAIVVGDTDTSLTFYRDTLGMRIAGTSENYGTEQEHLNNVFGARLRITALRAADGPGIEFLEYLAPRDGRPIPADARANDLSHWDTVIRTSDADAAAQQIRQHRFGLISPGAVTLADDRLGYRKGFLVSDPDGHVVRMIEQ